MYSCTVAADVGGSAVKLAYGTPDGRLHQVRRVPISDILARGDLIGGIVHEVREAVLAAPEHLHPSSVGLVVPGIVDEAKGIGRLSVILGWRDIPFVQLVTEATGLPVGFGHDVCGGAMAEGHLGAARGHTEWLFLALGTGLGSAFVLGGRPYRGSSGYGGELSHVVAVRDGPLCRCGKRGCLEMLASASGLVAQYKDVSGRDEPLTAAQLTQRVREGDAAAARVWQDAVSALATVVAGYVESMNPTAVVVGGGLTEAGELLMKPLGVLLEGQVKFADRPTLRVATLGPLAGLHGAALIGLRASGLEVLAPTPSARSPVDLGPTV